MAYSEVLARNIRGARSRQGIGQKSLATRMRVLGYTAWFTQTVGKAERGERRITAEEILGLAACMGTTVQRLMTPLWEDRWVELPSGESLRVGAVVALVTGEQPPLHGGVAQDIQWHGDTLVRTVIPPHEGEAAFSRDTPEVD